MTDLIQYTPNTYAFTGSNYPTCSPAEFVNKIKNKEPVYEVIPSGDKLMKFNLDFDYYIDPVEYNLPTINSFANILQERVASALKAQTGIDPCLHSQTSHSNAVLKKDGTITAKYSIRFYASNVICSRENNKNFVTTLNKHFNETTEETELWEYIDKPTDAIFDQTIYSPEKKMRCNGTSKPNENRPLILTEGSTIEGTLITAYFDPDAVELIYDAPEVTNKKYVSTAPYTGVGTLDTHLDEIRYYIANEAFKTNMTTHLGWIALGGMLLSCLSSQNAFDCWNDATIKNGSINKIFETDGHFQHLKKLIDDPILAINTIRKNIKKEFPSLITNWKELCRMQQKAVQDALKEQLRLSKEAMKTEKLAEKNAIKSEKAEKLAEKEAIKVEKLAEKDAERIAVELRRSNHTFVDNDNDAIDLIVTEIQHLFAYTQSQMYYKDGNKWVHDDAKINTLLMKHILESCIYRCNDDALLIPYCQNVGTTRNVREGLIAKLTILKTDDALYHKFHSSTKNKLCFEDGVLDFANKIFTLWINIPANTIYTTIIIDRTYADYFNNPDLNLVKTINEVIIVNLFGDKSKYALQFFSRAIAGNIQDKNFMSYCGNRNCGKGIFYDTTKYAFGEYVVPFDLENMTCKRNSSKGSDTAKENAWLFPLQYGRLAICQETDENENDNIKNDLKISNKIMKKIMSGGDTITARPLYGNAIDFTIDSTLCVFGNNELSISGSDSSQHHIKFQGVKQFISQTEYDKQLLSMGEDFVSSLAPADPTLKDKVKTAEYCNAMVHLLYSNFVNTSLTVSAVNCDDDDKILSIREAIFTHYKVTKKEGDRVSKEDLYELLKMDKKKIIAELKQMGCVGDSKCRTSIEVVEDGVKITKQVQAFQGLVLKV